MGGKLCNSRRDALSDRKQDSKLGRDRLDKGGGQIPRGLDPYVQTLLHRSVALITGQPRLIAIDSI